MKIMYNMDNNLGIYNSQVNPEYDINAHIQQGIQFKKFGNDFYNGNRPSFLQESSAPEWGSIVDACNGDNSICKKGLLEGMTMDENQIQFNNLVAQYATAYNTYTSTILKNLPSDDATRLEAEADLSAQQTNIIASANELKNHVQQNIDVRNLLMNNYDLAQTQFINNVDDMISYNMNEDKKKDDITINAAMENTALNMNSMYYHVVVYLFVAATLIGFIFYMMVNPNANVMNAIYVLGALFVVYFISRKKV